MRIHRPAVMALTALLAGCVTAPPGQDYPRPISVALPHPQQPVFGARFAPQVAAHSGASAFHILTAGVDGLLTRVQMINAAQKSLNLQYYIFRGHRRVA